MAKKPKRKENGTFRKQLRLPDMDQAKPAGFELVSVRSTPSEATATRIGAFIEWYCLGAAAPQVD